MLTWLVRQKQETLQAQSAEIRRQNETLQQQTEELQAQAEELQFQSEEIQAQNEELRQTNDSLLETQRRLAESEKLYRTIGELIPFGIWVCDPAGGMIYLSDSFLELVGKTLEECLELGWVDRLPPEDRERTTKDWLHHVESGALWDYEHHILGTDGQYRTILSRGVPVRDAQGDITSWVGINLDITDRKRVEGERERLLAEVQHHAAELAAANRELEAFTYSVAHDLRSPVRHMDGFSKVLMERYADKLDERGQQNLRFVREGSVKMGQLIDDLLALTGVTRSEVHRKAVDLSGMAQAIATELQQEQPARQVEFVIAPGVVANADLRLMQVVLDNLLDNAWKFTAKHERARIEFGVRSKDGQTVYFVQDDGAGFNMAYADKLFRAFERLHNADEFPGTGIGLATVERVIRRHGGKVWAEGEVDKGATFYFTLS